MGATRGDFVKYPRTKHLKGSKPSDDDKILDETTSHWMLNHPGLVVEEKIDGTNTGVHFKSRYEKVLQCRGHEITPGMHPQFDVFKAWCDVKSDVLWDVLSDRYIMYGEWCMAVHHLKYTRLPHYFFEFDIYDKQKNVFLDTDTRHTMLKGTGIRSVPVIHRGSIENYAKLEGLIVQSLYTDDLMEGLYIKIEENGLTVDRAKYVRREFTDGIIASGEHWQSKAMVENGLAEGVSIWE